MIQEAEKEAKERNCSYISLDTFSFQATKFYEKMGFEKIGAESDFPKGYEKYIIEKEYKTTSNCVLKASHRP